MINDICTAILDTRRVPQCEPDCTPEEGCDVCFVYTCAGCGEVKSWDNGGTDSDECDECWLRANPGRAVFR